MRFINREKLRPLVAPLLADLAQAAAAVAQEDDPARRKEIIEAHQGKWAAFRDVFAEFSQQKCWYTEALSDGADNDVDHFRPKSGVKEDATHPGYYWLAFDWTNYRLSCQRANRPRRRGRVVGGKAEHFPLLDPAQRARVPTDDLHRERPLLIDPMEPGDPPLIYFKPNGEADLAPKLKDDHIAKLKVEASLLCLHLNWPRFTDARLDLYNRVAALVDRGAREAPTDFSHMIEASEAFKDVIRDLRALMAASAPYSVAARGYIEGFRNVWWVDQIVLVLDDY